MCFVSLFVLRLTNIGFVQCLHLGSLWNFARVCFYVLRTSPRIHRVCEVLFPRPLLSLYACVCHIMLCALRLTNIGFVQCFSLGSLVSLYAYVSRFVMRTSPHKHRVCVVLAPRFRLEFCTRVLMFRVLCLTNIRFVQCPSLGPLFKFLRLFFCYVMCTSPHKHQFRAVLSSRLIFKFTRLYWPRFVKTVKFVSAFLKKFETL